ncbi:protein arginine kinase [Parachlamydia sp. AcF125]|uniref:protein arginine kinase n=1 Tax=Parachlamydia sp. AcF125 TaxID=2795736 RepID=UPI001BCA5081|nr:protein arginine kinase [Parachlamydia sp. AcF125]
MKKNSDFLIRQTKPWANNRNTIWLATTATLNRNIEKFKFPSKLSSDQKKQIISLVSHELLQSNHLADSALIRSEELGPLEKEFLVEHFLSEEGYQQAHGGEAFILGSSGEFLLALNVKDHMQITWIDCHGEIEQIWSRLVKLETTLRKVVTYAFSPNFGFLTADPSQCGTALTITVLAQPSALIQTGEINQTLARLGNETLTITSLQGNPHEIIGDLLAIRNRYTLGVTEENVIASLRAFITKLVVEESTARMHLHQQKNPEVMDKVSRAFGVLVHSYKLEAIEALNAISLLKLGTDLGWLTGITVDKLNELFFACRRAHLLFQCGDEKIPQEEIPHKRAEFVHKALKNATLTI